MSKARDLTYIYTKTTPTPRFKQRFEDTSWRCESMGLNTKPLIKPFQVVRRTAKVTVWPSHVEEDELRFFTAGRVRGNSYNKPSKPMTRRLNETQHFAYLDTCRNARARLSQVDADVVRPKERKQYYLYIFCLS